MRTKLTVSDLTITVTPRKEDRTPEEGYGVPDDPVGCKEFATSVKRMVRRYGLWGWCYVEVKATFGSLSSVTTLWTCSFRDEEHFRQSGYMEDMTKECLDDIQAQLDDIIGRLT